ncbi:hypothetical protein COS33_01140 [Candidatus Wolfebacteria bacterium CG02_land_8_20_14_3_00_37_12]|uniref:Uncharacterized protein n=3 Tax=Candidatus Wolfeibacteriota TaxID=1752735 RepID=A0A2M7Q846_9BACT|nr:MAG: hypothetical protein COS33_01140 [Candidatus Wolfebacteria bacterium CG02_land_8_20_14_3_00_37_12]PIY59282.1 MAG: hypothetical protein COY96_02650 [Candidatus Wolfebacteria bacterium CG_4_10_14_0_8_um_filter_37_11]
MNTITISKKEYQDITCRQAFFEEELNFLKKIVLETEENFIQPAVLRRWERISSAVDCGKGQSFVSVKDMKRWLKKL